MLEEKLNFPNESNFLWLPKKNKKTKNLLYLSEKLFPYDFVKKIKVPHFRCVLNTAMLFLF